MRGRRRDQDRVAVRLRAGDLCRADRAGGAAAIVDDQLLAEDRRDLGAEMPAHVVGLAAGWERDDKADRLGRVALLCLRGVHTEQCGARDGDGYGDTGDAWFDLMHVSS